jgi:hypothetical protein
LSTGIRSGFPNSPFQIVVSMARIPRALRYLLNHPLSLAGFLCCLLAGAPAAHGQSRTIYSGVDSVVLPYNRLTDADGTIISGIQAEADITFGKNLAYGGTAVSARFRVGFQLVDSGGTPVMLNLAGGGTGTIVYQDDYDGDPDQGFLIELAASESAFSDTFQAILRPAVALDPYEAYSVRAISYWRQMLLFNGNPIYIWSTDGTQDSTQQNYYHFTSTVSGDNALNVISVLESVGFSDRSALAGGAGQSSAFAVTANTTLHRFDDWAQAPAPAAVDVVYDVELWRVDTVNGDEQIPLVDDRIVISEDLLSHTYVWIYLVPETQAFNHELALVPDGVQLDSVNDAFYARVTVSHVEVPATNTERPGNTVETADTQLMHFNGTLMFNTIETELDVFTNDPAVGASWASSTHVSGSISGAAGAIAGGPGYTWGPAGLSVRLLPDGTALVVTPSPSVAVTPPASPDFGALGGIRFERSNLQLGHGFGLQGTLTLYLPTGMGWAPSASQHNFSGKLVFSGESFTQGLDPAGAYYSYNPAVPFFVMEETKPLAFEAAAITWDVAGGLVEAFSTGSAGYVRADELAELEASPVDPQLKVKRSNEQYYRGIDGVGGTAILQVNPGPAGEALLSGEIKFKDAAFRTHFPYDVGLSFLSGYAVLVDDQFDPLASVLTGLDVLSIQYNQACVDDGCGAPAYQEMRMYSDLDTLYLTSDGGLVTTGWVDNAVTPDWLAWGYIASEGDFHHETTPFAASSFHMPGHFIRGDQDTGPGSSHAPGVILYSGFLASDPQQVERPGTNAYLLGLADYAGINYRTGGDGLMGSDSLIAGQSVLFDLTGRSKYYIRPAGVTGIHEAVPGTFPSSLALYGYQMTFSQYGLNYRMNAPDESRTSGSVVLPDPSDFEQAFDELAFTCVGGLGEMKLPAGPNDHTMSYWLANITIHTMGFASENGCDPFGTTLLTAGVSAEAAYVEVPLYGTLAWLPDGELVSAATPANLGFDSRLHLPAVVRFDGPAKFTDPDNPGASSKEVYQLVPVSLAYYNDHASSNEQAQGQGMLNFAGTLDVAFFEDLEVHMQTSARNVLPTQSIPIRLMGGWNDSGDTFFNSPGFDPGNRGFPAGVPEAVYRNDAGNGGDPTPYLIHARQSWLGVINFDYPLRWSSSTRSFESHEPKTNDLLVIQAEHQLNYLSAETADLSIGITYDGMPQVSLTNFVINQVDEATGAYQALLMAAKKPVVDSIEQGIDQMADMLNDRMEAVFDPFFSTVVEDKVITPIFDDLEAAATNLTYDPTLVQNTLQFHLQSKSDSLLNLIRDLATEVNGVNYLFAEVDGRLADIETGLSAIIDTIHVDNLGNVVPTPTINTTEYAGFLTKNLDGDFQILIPLVERLLDELAPEISDELNTLLAGAVDDLNARINELFEEVKPTVDQLVLVLTDLRDVVSEVRDAIAPAGEMLVELEAILVAVGGPGGEIETITNQIRTEMDAFFATIAAPEDFLAQTEEEIKTRLRAEVKDIFFSGQFVAEIQVTLKQYLYDVDAAINAAISEAFAQVNKVMRDLVSDALAGVDDTINGFLGDIESVVGAGKLNGYGQFNGDALRKLHVDLYLQLMIPDEMEFNGYLTIEQRDSEGDDTCSPGAPGGALTEVSLGAIKVPADWIAPDLRVTVGAKFNFQSDPGFKLLGMGGSFQTHGEISFETFRITDMGASMMFGASENYLAAKLGLAFNSYEAFGGVFFGRTCSLDPLLLVDKDVAEVLGEPAPTFTGVYVYGECHIPISEAVLGIPASCMFRISAGVGAGAFYFTEGNTLGGKIYAAASGEALCVVSIKGEVTLIGLVTNGELRFRGKGRLSGKAGPCPLCVKFGKTATVTYQGGSWDVDL